MSQLDFVLLFEKQHFLFSFDKDRSYFTIGVIFLLWILEPELFIEIDNNFAFIVDDSFF